jgi:hypothetical protein
VGAVLGVVAVAAVLAAWLTVGGGAVGCSLGCELAVGVDALLHALVIKHRISSSGMDIVRVEIMKRVTMSGFFFGGIMLYRIALMAGVCGSEAPGVRAVAWVGARSSCRPAKVTVHRYSFAVIMKFHIETVPMDSYRSAG